MTVWSGYQCIPRNIAILRTACMLSLSRPTLTAVHTARNYCLQIWDLTTGKLKHSAKKAAPKVSSHLFETKLPARAALHASGACPTRSTGPAFHGPLAQWPRHTSRTAAEKARTLASRRCGTLWLTPCNERSADIVMFTYLPRTQLTAIDIHSRHSDAANSASVGHDILSVSVQIVPSSPVQVRNLSPARCGLAWSPYGSMVAVPGHYHDVVCYERLNWKPLLTLRGEHTARVNLVAFSHDGALQSVVAAAHASDDRFVAALMHRVAPLTRRKPKTRGRLKMW